MKKAFHCDKSLFCGVVLISLSPFLGTRYIFLSSLVWFAPCRAEIAALCHLAFVKRVCLYAQCWASAWFVYSAPASCLRTSCQWPYLKWPEPHRTDKESSPACSLCVLSRSGWSQIGLGVKALLTHVRNLDRNWFGVFTSLTWYE